MIKFVGTFILLGIPALLMGMIFLQCMFSEKHIPFNQRIFLGISMGLGSGFFSIMLIDYIMQTYSNLF